MPLEGEQTRVLCEWAERICCEIGWNVTKLFSMRIKMFLLSYAIFMAAAL